MRAEHQHLYHFCCLAKMGYPAGCDTSCYRQTLLQWYMDQGLKDCWSMENAPPGALTGWIVDYSYVNKAYDVLFDTGVLHTIKFDDRM